MDWPRNHRNDIRSVGRQTSGNISFSSLNQRPTSPRFRIFNLGEGIVSYPPQPTSSDHPTYVFFSVQHNSAYKSRLLKFSTRSLESIVWKVALRLAHMSVSFPSLPSHTENFVMLSLGGYYKTGKKGPPGKRGSWPSNVTS